MTVELAPVAPPRHGVYRLARRPGAGFGPVPWEVANPVDGTFGNRFDDPGQALGIPQEERFRAISCATERIGTIMESLARFRRSLPYAGRVEAGSRGVREGIDESLRGTFDPGDPSRGLVPAAWRMRRQIGHTLLDPELRFVDIAAMSTLSHLREAMAPDLRELGLTDLDLSVVTGPQRTLTQRIARYVYEQVDLTGTPRFAGIRYLSRFGDAQECWAIFDTRMVMRGTVIEQSILPDDPDLLAVAKAFGLTIEVLGGPNLRP